MGAWYAQRESAMRMVKKSSFCRARRTNFRIFIQFFIHLFRFNYLFYNGNEASVNGAFFLQLIPFYRYRIKLEFGIKTRYFYSITFLLSSLRTKILFFQLRSEQDYRFGQFYCSKRLPCITSMIFLPCAFFQNTHRATYSFASFVNRTNSDAKARKKFATIKPSPNDIDLTPPPVGFVDAKISLDFGAIVSSSTILTNTSNLHLVHDMLIPTLKIDLNLRNFQNWY